MLTLMTSILATALLAQSPDSIFLSGVVVDAAGKPLSDVEVVLPARRLPDGSVPTLAHTMTDEQGAFRLEVARQRFQEIGPYAVHLGLPSRPLGRRPTRRSSRGKGRCRRFD